MSLNGSGVYSVNSAGQPVVATTLITAAAFNAFTADIATALSSAVFKDGQQTVTANIPMGGFRFTGLGSGNASRTMSAMTGDVQDNLANWCGTAGGTANALTLTPTPAITAYLAGQSFTFKSGASANTAATTVAINGLSTIAIQLSGVACSGGEIQASKWYRITLDTTSTCQLEAIDGWPLVDTLPFVKGSSDSTKKVRFEVDGLTTGTTRVITMPDSDVTLGNATSAATQAEMEAASSTSVFASPGRQRYHPSAAKMWAYVTNAGTPALAESYNCGSVVDNGVGDTTINLTVGFSSVNFAAQVTNNTAASTNRVANVSTGGATSVRVLTFRNTDAAATDDNFSCSCFGDQ